MYHFCNTFPVSFRAGEERRAIAKHVIIKDCGMCQGMAHQMHHRGETAANTHKGETMRCYNGCPDTKLQAKIDAHTAAREYLSTQGLVGTYFPVEGQWMLFNERHMPVSGFYNTLAEAAQSVRAREV